MALAVAFFAISFYGMITPAMAQGNMSSHQCVDRTDPYCDTNGGCDVDNGESCGSDNTKCLCIKT
jgi:hypothetical protein